MWHRKTTLVALAFGFVAPGQLYAQGARDIDRLSSLPDVRLVSASEKIAPVPHCKITGVIGTETNFELLLPDKWNGKFVMGGGGGFVGSVVNIALLFGPLQRGYATVGTDMDRCDALDGLEDGILNNPLQCWFDVSALACTSDNTDACLSAQEVEAAKRIYNGVSDDEGLIFPGYPPGGELSPKGWLLWLTGGLAVAAEVGEFQEGTRTVSEFPEPVTPNAHFAFGNGVMKYLIYHDPEWSYADYSFETFRSDAAVVAPTLNATNPDLSAFRERGGKLLIWIGWADMALSPLGTIAYYEQVLAADPNASEDVCLFLKPGVDHCAGGVGPDWINYLDEIDKWVSAGDAPEQITAYWRNEQFQPDGSRPVCAYPKYVKYNGTGSPREASSFSCVEAE